MQICTRGRSYPRCLSIKGIHQKLFLGTRHSRNETDLTSLCNRSTKGFVVSIKAIRNEEGSYIEEVLNGE